MSNRDEEIIAQKRAIAEEKLEQNEKEQRQLEIDDIRLVRQDFDEYGFSISIPEGFEEMDEEFKEALYPYGKYPRYVYAGENIPFQFSVNKTENVVPNEGIPKFMPIAKQVMERVGPQAKILACYAIKKEEYNIGMMEIASFGLDGPVYNMQFYLSMSDQKIIICALTCQAKRHELVLPVFKKIIDSIVIHEKEVN